MSGMQTSLQWVNVVCKRNATQKRKLDANNICLDCKTNVEPLQQSEAFEDEKLLADVKFGDFRKWISFEIQGMIQAIVVKQLESLEKELGEVKKENKDLSKKLSAAEARLDSQEKELDKNTESIKAGKKVSENNLKYLINLDRNIRRKNVILFGVPEKDDLTIHDDSATSGIEKYKLLSKFMDCSENTVVDHYRLDREGDKPRPIKLTFDSKEMAGKVLSNSRKLKDLKNEHESINCYVKPDKTKSEQAEFQLLGKKKAELLIQYPTIEGNDPRVILRQGSLKMESKSINTSLSRPFF